MIMAVKIRLRPTSEQEALFWKSAGTARWAFNYFLAENQKQYEAFKRGETKQKGLAEEVIRKRINNELKPTTHQWLKEVGSNVMKQAVKDANEAFKRFLKGEAGYPKFKSKRKSKPSFYVRYETLKREPNGFRGERLGYVKTAQPLPELKEGEKYSNPRITYDGKNWFISVGFTIEPEKQELTDTVVGIDLGVKNLAICSTGKVYKNINKSRRVKELKKKLRRAQRKLSRKLLANTKGYTSNRRPIYTTPLKDCKNIQKQNDKIRTLYKKLSDIRKNHLHQTTPEIVKNKPFRIVMEDLNVSGMMKNRHLSKAIAEQGFYEFIRQMKYKCEETGIEFIQTGRFYPSSKKCSNCGHIKHDLKLSERTYICPECGLAIDRDLNAAINLANYQPA